jgi:hypothetical protein
MRRVFALSVTVAAVWSALPRAQSPSLDLPSILTRVGAAVERYYERAQTVMWLEDITFQTLGSDLMPDRGLYRRLTYDLRVVWDVDEETGARAPRVQRDLLTINGRAPRASDKPRCGDPPPVLPDTLEFLLPAKQAETLFTLAGTGKVNGRPAIQIDYQSRQRGGGTLTEHDDDPDCISMEIPGAARGRIWVNPETADILKVDEHLMGPVDMRWAKDSGRRPYRLEPVVVERLDSSVTFRAIEFTEPDERIMLPVQVDSMRVIRNLGDPRMRTTQRFSKFRRFTTDARIVE